MAKFVARVILGSRLNPIDEVLLLMIRLIFRTMRLSLAVGFVIFTVMTLGYVTFVMVDGIVDEINFRQEQAQRDEKRQLTATAVYPTIENETTELQYADDDSKRIFGAAPKDARLVSFILPSPTANLLETYFSGTPTAIAQDATPTLFSIPTNTLPPTNIPTNTPYPSNTPTASHTSTPTITATPTNTFTPTMTPTATPTPRPTLIIEGTYTTPVVTPIVDIPFRAPLAENDPNIINILLLGADDKGQTDVVIILSLNRQAQSAAMWHIPRDLIVYIPNNEMNRINVVFGRGSTWPGGSVGLLKETILYNFGIQIDFYARVNFNSFKEIINELGGLEVSVDCPIRGWRLKEEARDLPESTVSGDDWEPYWEIFTLETGVHELDAYMALWYARDRQSTSDLDRGRRQMDILRAMWYQARQQGLFTQAATLWPRALEIIETDMQLEDILSFIPMAMSMNPSNIERFSLRLNEHVTSWLTPDDGRNVLLPNRDLIYQLVRQFITPPTQSRVQLETKTIEIIDGTQYGLGWDKVAADRLAWEGFNPEIQKTNNIARHDVTLIYDYTGERKGSEIERIQTIVGAGNSQVIVQPDPNRTHDYRIVVGRDYGYSACNYSNSADELPDTPLEVTEPE